MEVDSEKPSQHSDDASNKKPTFGEVTTEADVEVGSAQLITAGSQQLHRKLESKEVQLFAIGGAIGTSLYVQMGSALPKGGPAGLFIGFVVWGAVMLCVNECFAEMVCYAPIPSPFIRLAGHFVDKSLEFAMGWNLFLNMALLIPFEIVAFNILLGFWTDSVPVEAIIVAIMVAYAVLNVVSVKYFGVAEFYLSIGFRYWNDPGAFVEHLVPGSTGRFLGVLSCIVQATFSICGPEYISMVAGETAMPRKVLPKAFRSFVWRILLFFVSSSLAMGIIIPYNDPTLNAVLDGNIGGSGTGAASPYVIGMDRLKVSGLPHVVNALIMTSVFSSGNGIFLAATRTLYGMAIDGTAPKFFSKTLRNGVPIYTVLMALAFCCLAFLQVNSSSAEVLTWLVDLITACQLLNYGSVAFTYLHFHAAVKKQGIDRRTLPYRGKFQPYTAYVAMSGCGLMLLLLGYDLFITGGWDVTYFFLDYTFLAAFPLALAFWKIIKRTTYVRAGNADLEVNGLVQEIDEYEQYTAAPSPSRIAVVTGKLLRRLTLRR
ncbi:hypothetical protein M409DRAFT_20586 [Zasmidium cellare ATCC 36951]|uniref:Amino acid permease/ SLC12A domain-containing protein n=1 Tax=Zasmidium cellare ATCC 36951 TaxID=1080233 RepID=A0A6A6CRN8_ZASCE|nr:uncharacterized protein M409DRAFT_20586 [Zasmidium cellare ATCC 36951]KAF2169363.1 hypothetical protein M409DRAFT_20586 [Zasmidium cellare ATCC 36951]